MAAFTASGRGGAATRRVLRAGALFSGTRVVTILCGLVKWKLVALWLGTAGAGLFGILGATLDTASAIAGLQLRQSAVREVAACREPGRLARLAAVVRRWSLFCGLAGAVLLSALSPLLAQWILGSAALWWQFALLAFALLANILSDGELALLQGAGRLAPLARIVLCSSVGGVLISIPLFRWAGEASVPLSFVAYGVSMLVAALWWRLRTPRVAVTLPEVRREGSAFVRLGICMAVAVFFTNVAQLIFVSWLNHAASTRIVGLYQSGATLSLRYAGILFAAVAVEFYPRLASVASSRRRMSVFVSHEMLVLMGVAVPAVLFFIAFKAPVIRLLYSAEFEPMVPMAAWAVAGCVPRAISFCMAYTILAHGRGRLYMLVEGIDALIGLALNIGCYLLWGLTGLGVAVVVWYCSYTLLCAFVYYRLFRLRLSRGAIIWASAGIIAAGAALWLPPAMVLPFAGVFLGMLIVQTGFRAWRP